jgi:hypothetical protein
MLTVKIIIQMLISKPRSLYNRLSTLLSLNQMTQFQFDIRLHFQVYLQALYNLQCFSTRTDRYLEIKSDRKI